MRNNHPKGLRRCCLCANSEDLFGLRHANLRHPWRRVESASQRPFAPRSAAKLRRPALHFPRSELRSRKLAGVLGKEQLKPLKTGKNRLLKLRPPCDRIAPCLVGLKTNLSLTRATLNTSGRAKSKFLSVKRAPKPSSYRL